MAAQSSSLIFASSHTLWQFLEIRNHGSAEDIFTCQLFEETAGRRACDPASAQTIITPHPPAADATKDSRILQRRERMEPSPLPCIWLTRAKYDFIVGW
jgi:hypothetical protein